MVGFGTETRNDRTLLVQWKTSHLHTMDESCIQEALCRTLYDHWKILLKVLFREAGDINIFSYMPVRPILISLQIYR